jgi:hypothetical protein
MNVEFDCSCLLSFNIISPLSFYCLQAEVCCVLPAVSCGTEGKLPEADYSRDSEESITDSLQPGYSKFFVELSQVQMRVN